MALSEILDRCADQWQLQGVSLAPPIDEAEVRRVWNGLGQGLSADVLCLYTTVGGFTDYESEFKEDFFWSLWPWDWLQKRNAEDTGDGVMFCDHSIEIITWEFRYEDESRSSVWNVQQLEQVASSVESFFQRYLEDPWQLL